MEKEELKNRMQELQKQFEEVNQKIDDTVNAYNQKIIELQKEGQEIVRGLELQREQIRGAYTENYHKLQKISGDKKGEKPQIEESKIGEVAIADVSMQNPYDTDNVLTEEEINSLQNVINEEEKEDNNKSKKSNESKSNVGNKVQQEEPQVNEEDIPDYLKEEYNKNK